MQVVILCGGMGTRIRDVTEDLPKPMIPIGGKPILWHIMKSYAQYGFKSFILCLGYRSWVIKQYFLDYGLAHSDLSLDLLASQNVTLHGPAIDEDWHVTLAETGLETMTGGRLKAVEKYIRGSHFMLTYGDGLADLDVRDLVAFHTRHGKLGTVTAVMPPSRFGEIEVDGHRQVTDFNEKPLVTRGRINGGFFVFHRSFLDRLPADPGLILEREPLAQLSRDGELCAYLHDGYWHCMDNSRDYHHLNELWDSGARPWLTGDCHPRRAAA